MVFFFYGEIDSEMLARVVVLIELFVIILHKTYALIAEKSVLGNTVSTLFRKNSFIEHNNVYYTITDEINRFFITVCSLLWLVFILLSLISGYLIKLLAVCILANVILFISRSILFYNSIGKILDYNPEDGISSFIRGYAKLFLLEENTTKFKKDHSIYKNYVFQSYSKGNERQDLCIKSTLFFEAKYQIKHERAKWMIALGCMLVNILILFYQKTDLYISETIDFYHLSFLSGIPVTIIIVAVLNTLICLISTATLLRYHYTCNYVKKIFINFTNDNAEERYNAYKRIDKKKTDFKKIRGLGLLTVCVDRGYNSNHFFEKDLLYLPLLRHHLRMPIKGFAVLMMAVLLSLLMLFINKLGITGIIILICSTLFGLLLLYFVIIPAAMKAIIKHSCKKLKQKLS